MATDESDGVGTNQYLTFTLDEEIFGLVIGKVREVLDYTEITKVPRMPDYMLGVINLRGSVVPVVDLHLKFGLSEMEKTVNTCIIIVEVDMDGEVTVMGALADAVQEVLELDDEHIEPAPKIGTKLDTAFIRGMGKKDDEFVILLNIDKVFSADEIEIVKGINVVGEEAK